MFVAEPISIDINALRANKRVHYFLNRSRAGQRPIRTNLTMKCAKAIDFSGIFRPERATSISARDVALTGLETLFVSKRRALPYATECRPFRAWKCANVKLKYYISVSPSDIKSKSLSLIHFFSLLTSLKRTHLQNVPSKTSDNLLV